MADCGDATGPHLSLRDVALYEIEEVAPGTGGSIGSITLERIPLRRTGVLPAPDQSGLLVFDRMHGLPLSGHAVAWIRDEWFHLLRHDPDATGFPWTTTSFAHPFGRRLDSRFVHLSEETVIFGREAGPQPTI